MESSFELKEEYYRLEKANNDLGNNKTTQLVNHIKSQLEEVIKKLNISPIELVRTKESIWIENYKGKELTDDQIIDALLKNPKLIERPIIVNGNKAVIARPKEKINEIL